MWLAILGSNSTMTVYGRKEPLFAHQKPEKRFEVSNEVKYFEDSFMRPMRPNILYFLKKSVKYAIN